MVSEAPLRQTEHGLVATDDGWFVLNARPAGAKDGEGLLRLVGRALYAAKAAGCNRVSEAVLNKAVETPPR